MVVVISGSPSELTLEQVEYELYKAVDSQGFTELQSRLDTSPVFTHGSLTKSTSASNLCQYKVRNGFHHKPGARVPGRVGAGAGWSGVGTLASPLVEQLLSPRFVVEPHMSHPEFF